MTDFVEPYRILFAKQARKDIAKLTVAQKSKLKKILEQILAPNPRTGKPLKGDLMGLYSYRLNRKDRIVDEILEDDRAILIVRTRSHYGS